MFPTVLDYPSPFFSADKEYDGERVGTQTTPPSDISPQRCAAPRDSLPVLISRGTGLRTVKTLDQGHTTCVQQCVSASLLEKSVNAPNFTAIEYNLIQCFLHFSSRIELRGSTVFFIPHV